MTELDKVVRNLQKKYQNGVVMNLKKGDGMPSVPRFPVSSPKVGDVLGDGGVPQGRVIEIFGPESAGKTTIAYYLAGQIQHTEIKKINKKGEETTRKGQVAFVDAEHAVDPHYATVQGFDIYDSIFIQPDYGEQALDIVVNLAESGEVDFIAVDSVASLVPLAELEGEMGDQQMGLQARMMGKAMRKIVALANRNNCTILFLNQIRQKIGVMYGNPETTPGGNALKFHASIRLDVRRIDWIMGENKEPCGIKVRLKSIKNKTAPPMVKREIDIYFDNGIRAEEEWLDYAVTLGLIEKSASWFKLPNGDKIQGMEKLVEYFKDPEHKLDYDTIIGQTKKAKFPNLKEEGYVEVKDKTEAEIAEFERREKEEAEKASAQFE